MQTKPTFTNNNFGRFLIQPSVKLFSIAAPMVAAETVDDDSDEDFDLFSDIKEVFTTSGDSE